MFFSLLLALWMTYGVAGYASNAFMRLDFVKEPSNTVARKNEAVRLQCEVEGSPPATNFTWVKNGKVITVDDRVKIESDGALLINPVHTRKYKLDVGEYQCFASSSKFTIASRKVRLEVTGISRKFLQEPKNTTVRVGSVARFSCKPRHDVPPATIAWEKDGSPLKLSSRLVILDQGVLQIKNVLKSDEGNYRCIASNIAKTRYSQAAILSVKTDSDVATVGLKFIGVPRNTTVLKGRNAVLECAVTGYPVPTIRWTKLGENNGKFNAPRATYGIGNLNFSNVDESDEGQYECQATSNGRTISRTAWLLVRAPPKFTEIPAKMQWTTNKPIIFHCAATGLPRPTISWLKNGKPLITNNRTSVTYYEGGADLTLSDNHKTAMYQCFVQNEVGSIQAAVTAVVQNNQPGPPTNVVALAHSPSSILVTWSPPNGGYQIIGYTVHYNKPGGARNEEKQKTVESDVYSNIVTNLQPFTNYSFYVRAYTKAIGLDSKVITQQTEQDKPSRPPSDVMVTSSTPDSLEVKWQTPPTDYINGIITKYIITCTHIDAGQLPRKIIEVPGDIRHKTINGLSKGANYSIRVRAVTAAGQGPFSASVIGRVRTQPTGAISAPELRVVVTNSSMLTVAWNPPEFGEDSVVEYRLSYSQPQERQQGPFIVGKQQREYSLYGLDSGSEFLIKVMAWDGKMLGRAGAVIAKTDKDPNGKEENVDKPPPAPPINLVCRVKNRNSILLTWKSQPSPDRIAYYTITYYLRDDVTNTKPQERTAYTEQFPLTGLEPKKPYIISVQSHYETETTILPSYFSTTVTQCSIQLGSGPTAPRNIKYEYVGLSTVHITWDSPLRKNGKLTSFEIRYTYNKSLPESEWEVESRSLPFPATFLKGFTANLDDIQENKIFYIKVRLANERDYGPFCDMVEIQPPSVTSGRAPPNVSFSILSPKQVKLSWTWPKTLSTLLASFTVLLTNNFHLREDRWKRLSVASSPEEWFQSTVLNVDQDKTYYVKVRAEYADNTPGKWSEVIEVSTKVRGASSNATEDPTYSAIESNDPSFNIKLGVIIGCTISAFCVVVLVLFIIWRNPCRQAAVNNGKKHMLVNGQDLLPTSLLQQITVSSGSTEGTGSSGMCQCRCTCGASPGWPLRPSMVRASYKLPGSSDSTTPITPNVFPNKPQEPDM